MITKLLIILVLMALIGVLSSCKAVPEPSMPASASALAQNTVDTTPADLNIVAPEDPTKPYEDPIEKNTLLADIIIVGTVIDQKVERVDSSQHDYLGSITYTTFTFSVDKMVKGNPDTKEVFIRLPGGTIKDENGATNNPPWQGYFTMSQQALLFLKKGDGNYFTVMVPFGAPWWKKAGGYEFIMTKANGERMTLENLLGIIVKTMRINAIPIALPPNERPPEPVGSIVLPAKYRTASNTPAKTTVSVAPSGTPDVYEARLIQSVIDADMIIVGTVESKTFEKGASEVIVSDIVVRIEKKIKHDNDLKKVFIKVEEDGEVGDATTGVRMQLIETIDGSGRYYFEPGEEVVLFLKKSGDGFSLNIVSATSITHSEVDVPEFIGRIIKIMVSNNIPVALPEKEWPPLLSEPTTKP